ncbi:MAG: RNA polymerase factor sigma-32 [Desulfobia sp.]
MSVKKKGALSDKKEKHQERPIDGLEPLQDYNNLPVVSQPGLHHYLREISHHKLLSREETKELAIRVRENNDPDAAYQLATSNLRLVVKVAMDFQKYWMHNFLDLIQEGNVGLIQAVKKFDPYRGVKFSYYAAYWIRAYILKFIMDNWRLVKIGTTQAQRKLFFSLNKEKKLLEANGFKPETKLLAERLGVKESEVIEIGQRMDSWDLSLESPVREGSDDEQKNFISGEGLTVEEVVAGDELKEHLNTTLDSLKKYLNEKELKILSDRLLSDEPLTLQDIADYFHISRERVRQIEGNVLKKIKKHLENEMPDIQEYMID